MVPVTKTIMVPVTTTELVPRQVFVDSNNRRTVARHTTCRRTRSEPPGIAASAPAPAEVVAKVPSTADAETPAAAIPATVRSPKLDPTPVTTTVQVLDTKTIQPTVVRSIPLSIKKGLIAEVPRNGATTQVMTNSALPNGDNVIGTTSNVEVQFLGNVAAESTDVGSALRSPRESSLHSRAHGPLISGTTKSSGPRMPKGEVAANRTRDHRGSETTTEPGERPR